jgi:hypothetical protein
MKALAMAFAVLGLVVGLSAQSKKTEVRGLTGTWNMGLQGGHVIPVALVLVQDGSVLTGTISLPTQRAGSTVDVTLKGDVVNGSFALSGTVEGAKEPTSIDIKGKLNEDGMLEGQVTMGGTGEGHHDMTYTAERLKERK